MSLSNYIPRFALLAVVLLAQSDQAASHTDYAATLAALPSPGETTATGTVEALFPGQITCSTRRPLGFDLSVDGLLGAVTGITLRFGGSTGTLHSRILPEERSFEFDSAACLILQEIEYGKSTSEDTGNGLSTPMFLTVETDLFPEGEIGGQLFMLISLPVLEASWGEVKQVYR